MVKTKIKDIEEFCKLYKINIPVQVEFEYYIDTLKKSAEYKSIDKTIELYVDLEKYITENGFSSVRSCKGELLDEMVKYIMSTSAYAAMNKCPLSSEPVFSKDHLNTLNSEVKLVSLDFKSANYSVLKTFSEQEGELGKDWIDLCEMFKVHPAFINSKSFRQLVFGNTNPKRLQSFQRENMSNVIKRIQSGLKYKEEDFVFISHDEIILVVRDANEVQELKNDIKMLEFVANGMEIRITPFQLTKLNKKNTFIKTILSLRNNLITDCESFFIQEYYFHKEYSALHGTPGHKFYMYFKKHILNEPIDERDLMYYNDGELCKWIDEDAKKNKKHVFPHYEKPKIVVSMETAKGHTYMWDNLTNVLPHLTDEEKRRVVEVLVNSCRVCYQAPYGCQCWNED